MLNKSNLQLSSGNLTPDNNNPEEVRKKELVKIMKRFGELLDPPGFEHNDNDLYEERVKSIDTTPLKQQLRKRDRVKAKIQFKIYQRALSYSQSKQSELEFNSQFRLKKKVKMPAQSLTSFMQQKQTQKFLFQNVHTRNCELAQAFLQDNIVRQNILQKALLFERLYDQRKQQIKLKSASQIQIPKRFKGMNPKHIRLPSTPRTQKQLKHMQYVQYKKKLQFFQKSMSAHQKEVNNKIQANNNLINLVVSINEQYAKQKIQTAHDRELSLLFKRLFLHYSNHETQNPQNLYTYVSKQRAIQLLNDFNIQTDLIKKQQFRFPIGSFKFQQFIALISKQIYGQIKFPTKKIIKDVFYPQKNKFLHPLFIFIEIHKQQIKTYFTINMKKAYQLKKIFMKMLNKNNIELSDKVMFRQMFQKLWNLKVFPNLIAKSPIRFYFQSFNPDNSGIAFQEYKILMIIIALHIYKNEDTNITSKLNKFFSAIKPYVDRS